MELLIHAGINTLEMNGEGFKPMVKAGQSVKKGDLLLTMDLDRIRSAGYQTTVILAVTNSDEFSSVESIAPDRVNTGDDIMRVDRK